MCFILIDYNFFDHWSDDLSLLRGRRRAELLGITAAIIARLSAIVTTSTSIASSNGRIHRYAFLFHAALALVVVLVDGGATEQEGSIAATGRSHYLLHRLLRLVRDNNLIGFGSGRCGGWSRCHRVVQLKILGVGVILRGLWLTYHALLLVVVEGRSAGRLDVHPIGKCLLHWLLGRRLMQTCRLGVKLISIVRVRRIGGRGRLLLQLLLLLFLEQALLGHEFEVGLLLLLRIDSLFQLSRRGTIVRLLHGLAERGHLLRLRVNNVAPLIDK